MVVDFPESTWPITTTLMCIFSLLQPLLARCAKGGCGSLELFQWANVEAPLVRGGRQAESLTPCWRCCVV